MSHEFKQLIEKRLQCIANVLLRNAGFISNPGLLNGKMGIAIFFYRYGNYTGSKVYSTYADDLIDEIYNEIDNTQINFENGLTGIGWGISFLIQNGFIDAEPDEVLRDIDQLLFKNKQNQPLQLKKSTDLFSHGFYNLSRIHGNGNNCQNLDKLIIKQNLISLTYDLEALIFNKHLHSFNTHALNLATINPIVFFLLAIHKLRLYPTKIEELWRYLAPFLKINAKSEACFGEKITLLNFVNEIQSIVNNPDLKEQYATFASEISFDFPQKTDEALVRGFITMAWHWLIYAPFRPDNSIIAGVTKKVFTVIDNKNDWDLRLEKLNNNNMGLTGLAGLGLGLVNGLNAVMEMNEKMIEKALNG